MVGLQQLERLLARFAQRLELLLVVRLERRARFRRAAASGDLRLAE